MSSMDGIDKYRLTIKHIEAVAEKYATLDHVGILEKDLYTEFSREFATDGSVAALGINASFLILLNINLLDQEVVQLKAPEWEQIQKDINLIASKVNFQWLWPNNVRKFADLGKSTKLQHVRNLCMIGFTMHPHPVAAESTLDRALFISKSLEQRHRLNNPHNEDQTDAMHYSPLNHVHVYNMLPLLKYDYGISMIFKCMLSSPPVQQFMKAFKGECRVTEVGTIVVRQNREYPGGGEMHLVHNDRINCRCMYPILNIYK